MFPGTLRALAERYRRMRFNRIVGQVLGSPPIRMSRTSGLTLLSMVNHRDTLAYLLAAKTLARHVQPRRVVVVADPTLNKDDRDQIARHVEGIVFVEAAARRIEGLPSGGCWERLISIAEEVKSGYVIQLDADTVTLGEVTEVTAAVSANRSFLLASEAALRISDLATAAAWARPRAERVEHIQIQAEANLDALTGPGWRYVRGCAGFAGFPKGSFELRHLHELTEAMRSRLGDRWSEWGTEQVASNLICASQPGAELLPNPKYCNANFEGPGTEFLHFIGYTRFRTSRYGDLAERLCRELASGSQA